MLGNVPEEYPTAQKWRWTKTILGMTGGLITGIFFSLDDPLLLGTTVCAAVTLGLMVVLGAAGYFLSGRRERRLENALFWVLTTMGKGGHDS